MSYLSTLDSALKKTILVEDLKKFNSYDEIIAVLFKYFLEMRNSQSMLYFIGNGGSAAISMHMTTDFFKNGKMRTHGMHDPALITCLGNDYGYEKIFSKQIEKIAQSNDLLVAISSSGESANILNAVKAARNIGVNVITFSGFKEDNSLSKLGNFNLHVPSMNYGTVESIHNLILQDVVDALKKYDELNGGVIS